VADEFSSRELTDTRRVTIARGNVSLWQGSPDSDLVLQIRAQAAVAFSEKGLPAKQRTTPLAPVMGSVGTPTSGPAQAPESIAGVYLEGDVVISRGERYMTAKAAYYDFTTDRAIVVEPVFRTVQASRGFPIYVRAEEARILSAREVWFRDAKVTASDFRNPSYHIGASRVYVRDTTPYDDEGVRLGPPSYELRMLNNTFNVQGVPVLWWPYERANLEEGHTALRSAQMGHSGRFGWGVETGWNLFRLLGLVAPEGMRGRLDLDYYERGLLLGADVQYARVSAERTYSGYWKVYGMLDRKKQDEFGDERDNIPAPPERGRVLVRHKELLPAEIELQFELSYLCDRNFLEEFFRDEFYAGKEQETLIYAKKQKDSLALTALIQYRLNRFQSQAESWPDVAFRAIGIPIGESLTFFSENRAGLKKWQTANDAPPGTSSELLARLDSRNELDAPLHVGPLNAVPFATGRGTYWSDAVTGGDEARPYGQVGVKTNTHIWRVFNDAHSRLFDVNRLKHVITPELSAFASGAGGVEESDLFPLENGVERHIAEMSGFSAALYQRLQTKRGQGANEYTVDWMRLNLIASFFGDQPQPEPLEGRWFWSRPEHSLASDNLTAEYAWNISDATTFLADAVYNIENGEFFRADAGLAVSREPRTRYYLGMRWINPLDSAVATAGVQYQINPKYSLSVFEQYDLAYDSGTNLSTSVSIIRKFDRWFGGLTLVVDPTEGGVGAYLTFWPEGIPEFRLGTGRMGLPGRSSEN
jgi:hypothetical protein